MPMWILLPNENLKVLTLEQLAVFAISTRDLESQQRQQILNNEIAFNFNGIPPAHNIAQFFSNKQPALVVCYNDEMERVPWWESENALKLPPQAADQSLGGAHDQHPQRQLVLLPPHLRSHDKSCSPSLLSQKAPCRLLTWFLQATARTLSLWEEHDSVENDRA